MEGNRAGWKVTFYEPQIKIDANFHKCMGN